jgi:hypothetical protein
VPGAQEVRDVAHGLPGEQRQRLGLDAEEAPAEGLGSRHEVRREQAVGGLVLAERQQVLEGELVHGGAQAYLARDARSTGGRAAALTPPGREPTVLERTRP